MKLKNLFFFAGLILLDQMNIKQLMARNQQCINGCLGLTWIGKNKKLMLSCLANCDPILYTISLKSDEKLETLDKTINGKTSLVDSKVINKLNNDTNYQLYISYDSSQISWTGNKGSKGSKTFSDSNIHNIIVTVSHDSK